jgi:hypothetical protein
MSLTVKPTTTPTDVVCHGSMPTLEGGHIPSAIHAIKKTERPPLLFPTALAGKISIREFNELSKDRQEAVYKHAIQIKLLIDRKVPWNVLQRLDFMNLSYVCKNWLVTKKVVQQCLKYNIDLGRILELLSNLYIVEQLERPQFDISPLDIAQIQDEYIFGQVLLYGISLMQLLRRGLSFDYLTTCLQPKKLERILQQPELLCDVLRRFPEIPEHKFTAILQNYANFQALISNKIFMDTLNTLSDRRFCLIIEQAHAFTALLERRIPLDYLTTIPIEILDDFLTHCEYVTQLLDHGVPLELLAELPEETLHRVFLKTDDICAYMAKVESIPERTMKIVLKMPSSFSALQKHTSTEFLLSLTHKQFYMLILNVSQVKELLDQGVTPERLLDLIKECDYHKKPRHKKSPSRQ